MLEPNLGQDTSYRNLTFSWISSDLSQKKISAWYLDYDFVSNPFKLITHLSSCCLTMHSAATDSVIQQLPLLELNHLLSLIIYFYYVIKADIVNFSKNNNITLSLSLNKHYAMKVYGRLDVQIHIFLTSALPGGKWSASRPGHFTPRKRAPSTH
jgi:hypothetical protein